MSGFKYTAHFEGGKLHGQTMGIDDPSPSLNVPHFSYPGRHTHDVRYKLDRVKGADAFYVPAHPHVRELPWSGSPL